jgi:DNA-binding MarR family transcriptional regulator
MISSFVTLYKMSYNTEHVRNAGDTPRTITGIPTFAELLENPSLADLYTSIKRAETTTGPELVETTTVSKKTVYDYLHKLEQAGLISKVGDETGAAVYTAQEFKLTLTVRETEVSITPKIIEVIAQKNEYPAIERVLEDHGIVTLALAYDLVKAHSEGDVTIRQIASLTDLSPGTTYDLVEALYSVLDLGDDESAPTTYTPDELDADEGALLEEFADK